MPLLLRFNKINVPSKDLMLKIAITDGNLPL